MVKRTEYQTEDGLPIYQGQDGEFFVKAADRIRLHLENNGHLVYTHTLNDTWDRVVMKCKAVIGETEAAWAEVLMSEQYHGAGFFQRAQTAAANRALFEMGYGSKMPEELGTIEIAGYEEMIEVYKSKAVSMIELYDKDPRQAAAILSDVQGGNEEVKAKLIAAAERMANAK